ncbi:MAG: SDR family oxidoreductase [Betaproteobacteria bacterium]|jgi:2-keto-3-deoxy-L-fuconate dehydrogenase
MSSRLAGKTAFVTAAGQGIGRATAEAFAREGAHVIATDLNTGLMADLQGRPGFTVEKLDALDPAAIAESGRRHPEVDILFNAAGFVHHNTVLTCTEDEWDFAMNLNVRSMFRTTQAFLPKMLERGNGSIINISSGASSIKSAANRFVYGTSKAAVVGLTKAVAMDCIKSGVRCNAICPGTVESPSLRDRMSALSASSGKSLQEVEAMFVGRQPMGRLGTAEEIAAAALYLASDESRFTSGTLLIVDGGWTL